MGATFIPGRDCGRTPGWGLLTRNAKARIRNLELPAPLPKPQRRGTGAEFMIYHTSTRKPPLKLLNSEVQRASGLVNTCVCPDSRDRSSYARDPARPCHPMPVFIWLFICSLCNKPPNTDTSLGSVSCSSKLSNLRRGSWEHPVYAQ